MPPWGPVQTLWSPWQWACPPSRSWGPGSLDSWLVLGLQEINAPCCIRPRLSLSSPPPLTGLDSVAGFLLTSLTTALPSPLRTVTTCSWSSYWARPTLTCRDLYEDGPASPPLPLSPPPPPLCLCSSTKAFICMTSIMKLHSQFFAHLKLSIKFPHFPPNSGCPQDSQLPLPL